MIPVIPKRKNSQKSNPDFDKDLYKLRHLVENAFARLKHFHALTTRYDKSARNFKSMLYLFPLRVNVGKAQTRTHPSQVQENLLALGLLAIHYYLPNKT